MSINDKNKPQQNVQQQAPAPEQTVQQPFQPQGQPGFDPNNPQNTAFGQQAQQQGFQQNFQQQQPGYNQGVGFEQQQFNGFGNQNQQNEATARIARLSQALSPSVTRGGTSERAAQFIKMALEILELDKTNNQRYKLITLTPEQDSVALTRHCCGT